MSRLLSVSGGEPLPCSTRVETFWLCSSDGRIHPLPQQTSGRWLAYCQPIDATRTTIFSFFRRYYSLVSRHKSYHNSDILEQSLPSTLKEIRTIHQPLPLGPFVAVTYYGSHTCSRNEGGGRRCFPLSEDVRGLRYYGYF